MPLPLSDTETATCTPARAGGEPDRIWTSASRPVIRMGDSISPRPSMEPRATCDDLQVGLGQAASRPVGPEPTGEDVAGREERRDASRRGSGCRSRAAVTVRGLRGQSVSPPRDRGLRFPASPPARGGGEDIYSWRKAAAIGRRAARRAGNSPPRNPMTSAQRPPCTSSAGVTSKANATCENVCQLNVAVW